MIGTPISAERRSVHDTVLADENIFVVSCARELHSTVLAVRRRNLALIPNAVDVDHFVAERQGGDFHSVFRAALDRGRPIVGYFGAFASWVDVDLLKATARALPSVSVVAIGADHDGTLARLATERPENLLIVPSVRYSELPRYAAWFDVAVLPFRAGLVTDGASPLKLCEYMALGAPIVSTDVPEARHHDCVWIAADENAFIELCERALSVSGDATLRARLHQEAQTNSWDVRAAAFAESLSATGFLSSPSPATDPS